MPSVYQLLPNLTLAVKRAHEEAAMQHGHGFDSHVYRVASLALQFGEELGVGLLAGAAGLCHNADRLLAKRLNLGRREVPRKEIEALVRGWLESEVMFERSEPIGTGRDITAAIWREQVIKAVLYHEKPNEDTDDLVTVALKDADRVANAALDVVIRSGQFQPDLPVIDFGLLLEDKRGRYNGRLTIIGDLMDCLDWAKPGPYGVRTVAARKMIAGRVEQLRLFLVTYENQLREEGVLPYPLAG